jgi:hypothetical protein
LLATKATVVGGLALCLLATTPFRVVVEAVGGLILNTSIEELKRIKYSIYEWLLNVVVVCCYSGRWWILDVPCLGVTRNTTAESRVPRMGVSTRIEDSTRTTRQLTKI